MTIPYTYLLKFLPTNQVYYGVRYKEGCHPAELFITYFSSSNIIKRLINDHGISAFEFEIRQMFNTKKSARDWEQRVLTKIGAASNPRFLNQSNNMKGILREPGTYSWYYNPNTLENLLLKNSTPTPFGFTKGMRGPDKKQAGTVVAYNAVTGKQKKFATIDDITGDWRPGRPGGTTTGSKWICNDTTGDTMLITVDTPIPEGYRLGNKNIKNKNRIKITHLGICKSIYSEELTEYLTNGWQLGNPGCRYVKIFRLNGDTYETSQIHPAEYDNYKSAGWFKGLPILYKIYFNDGRVLTYPYQWFVKNMGISKDMILYAEKSGGKSPKFKFNKVERVK
jgi:hypothetical protein